MEFDLALPLFMFVLDLLIIFVYMRFEGRLKQVLEEREFQVKDIALLVVAMGVMVSIMVFVPSLALMLLFLFAFSVLTFTFSYIVTEKWYISIIPPTIFILLYYFGVFWNIQVLWNLYVLNAFVIIFAILITVYLGSLFTWKTTALFAILLTGMDIIQVLFTKHMVSVSQTVTELQLPLLIILPVIPPIYTEHGLQLMGLGLGDLFFTGLLGLQAFKEYGRNFAILSIIGMSASFFIFETLMLTYGISAFPGTLMIICGWFPLVVIKQLRSRSLS